MRVYILNWMVLTGMCLAACWALGQFAPTYAHESRYLVVLYMAALTLGVHLVGQRALSKPGEESIAWLMGTFGLQMLGSMVFVAIGLLKTWPGNTDFALTFLVGFMVYFTFEIRTLLANLRPQNRG